MKTLTIELGTLNLRCVVVALVLMVCHDCPAQIQQAWVARYTNGITNGTNQVVKMALDSTGNIYVVGFSENSLTNLGYVTIKYTPTGNQLWVARYDSTNFPTATPSGLVLDGSNNAVVTGSALTVKYDTNGGQLWTAPYDGDGIAMDAGGNSLVTGFGSGFYTVKISPTGTNLWLATYNRTELQGPWLSQAVVVDAGSNVYVAGESTYGCYVDGSETFCYAELALVKYDPNGNQLWAATSLQGTYYFVQVGGLAIDNAANIYIAAHTAPGVCNTFKYASNGTLVWQTNPLHNLLVLSGLSLDASGGTSVTSEASPTADSYPGMSYGTVQFDANGSFLWTNYYPQIPNAINAGTAITVDQAHNVYVTGYSPGTNSGNDIVTIKYGANGNQIWLQRYNGPGNGNDAGNAIALDNNGNVYVAGYDTTAAGGTEMVLIKYSPVILQRQPNGTVLLQTEGSPGESFEIQASADLLNWLDIGSGLADTNGLMQFDDTNAPNYPARFYLASPQ